MAAKKDRYIANLKILPDIPIPQKYQRDFQHAVETLAKDSNVPVALIMRIGVGVIEVFGTNTHDENPYVIGTQEKLLSGFYCETVMKTGRCLIVPNALKDELWNKNPDIKSKMIAYMGLPIYWPNGEVFGTVCLLNSNEHHFSDNELNLIKAVRKAIETDLATIYDQYRIEHHCDPKAVETSVVSRY